jgi:hypothetical protein
MTDCVMQRGVMTLVAKTVVFPVWEKHKRRSREARSSNLNGQGWLEVEAAAAAISTAYRLFMSEATG